MLLGFVSVTKNNKREKHSLFGLGVVHGVGLNKGELDHTRVNYFHVVVVILPRDLGIEGDRVEVEVNPK